MDMYKQNNLNMLLALPNGDLTWEDVEKPLPATANAELSLKSDISIVDQHKQQQYPNQLTKLGGSGIPSRKDSSQRAKRLLPGAGSGG